MTFFRGKPRFRIASYSGFPSQYKLNLFKDVKEEVNGKGCDPKKNDAIDNGNGFVCDNVRHVEFYPEMLSNLQKVPWRRVDVEFRVSRKTELFCVHDMLINKYAKLCITSQKETTAAAIQFCQFFMRLIELDHGLNMM